MTLLTLLLISFSSLVASFALTWLAWKLLSRMGVEDKPNERSSHTVPTPKGAGLAVILVILIALVAGPPLFGPLTFGPALKTAWALAASAAVLTIVSWLDDTRAGGLPPLPRLIAQFAAVIFTLIMTDEFWIGGSAPVWWFGIVILMLLAWLWFINLYNFMDGIDAIAGIETLCIAGGCGLVIALSGGDLSLLPLTLVIAVAALGFLFWNWPPARIFLGDVGSIPLGFVLGWLLLLLASHGQWAAALILPLYYLVDATLTLTVRLLAGKKPWHAHRDHFYQVAALRIGHGRTGFSILACNLVLIGMAALSTQGWTWLALGGATLSVLVLLIYFRPPWTVSE